jgi:hypothetical protein
VPLLALLRWALGGAPIGLSARGALYADTSGALAGLAERLDAMQKVLREVIDRLNKLADRVSELDSSGDVTSTEKPDLRAMAARLKLRAEIAWQRDAEAKEKFEGALRTMRELSGRA